MAIPVMGNSKLEDRSLRRNFQTTPKCGNFYRFRRGLVGSLSLFGVPYVVGGKLARSRIKEVANEDCFHMIIGE
jgi:hypothetical protein